MRRPRAELGCCAKEGKMYSKKELYLCHVGPGVVVKALRY
jgi:hypothetical protein